MLTRELFLILLGVLITIVIILGILVLQRLLSSRARIKNHTRMGKDFPVEEIKSTSHNVKEIHVGDIVATKEGTITNIAGGNIIEIKNREIDETDE